MNVLEASRVMIFKPAELHALCIIRFYIGSIQCDMQFDVNIRLYEY
jgi:hypothetical protein